MANILSDTKKQQVIALGQLGWTLRRIEAATGVRRETAGAYLKAAGLAVRPPGRWGRGTPVALAAKRATTRIPIVMTNVGDPVETGLVANLARPGGNITGLTTLSPELSGKRLELLKEVVPGLSRVAVLWNPANPSAALQRRETEAAARALGLRVQVLGARGPDDFEGAFKAARGAGAVLPLGDPAFTRHRTRLTDLADRSRLPAMYVFREFVESGGLMSYGVNLRNNYRRAAYFVDRILKGAKPADLPVEQPTQFELVINMKTAKRHSG